MSRNFISKYWDTNGHCNTRPSNKKLNRSIERKLQIQKQAAVTYWSWSRTHGRRAMSSSPNVTEAQSCRTMVHNPRAMDRYQSMIQIVPGRPRDS
ncbi:hypothetical protein TNCV_99051 [Trichonephila clavipes]|nr:hypothetical protein TNCV_99051 [Trichonephila clavipes]